MTNEQMVAVVRMEQLQRTHRKLETMGLPQKHICKVLGRHKDVFTNKLPQKLVPMSEVDYKIELIPGFEPPSNSPYRLNPNKMLELKKQLNDLLSQGYIRPSQWQYGAPVLFVD